MPKVIILRAPGTNCDQETAHAFRLAGTDNVEILHVNRLVEQPGLLESAQILCIPGGFSFGDDLASGRIFASKLENNLGEQLHRFHEADKLMLGICNGFQVLLKLGLFFPHDRSSGDKPDETPPATLTWNRNPLYTARWVRLQVSHDDLDCVFLRGLDKLDMSIAHAEGRFAVRDEETLRNMQTGRQIALRYHPDDNPNGSVDNVAGLCDTSGRVFGLMPHPERHLDALHHPQWTRRQPPLAQHDPSLPLPPGDGWAIFKNAVTYFA